MQALAEPKNEFVALLAQELETRGMRQMDLADMVQATRSHISDLLCGYRKPSVEMIDRICEALQFSPAKTRQFHIAAATDKGYRIRGA